MDFLKVVLAEKPAVGRELAAYLGARKRGKGYIEGNGWIVTWAFGHLVELKEPGEYQPEWKSWNLDTLPMVPERFGLRARGDKGAQEQLKTVRELFKKADEIVCATDAGREGELIFRYILQWARCVSKPVKRLWISSLTTQAIADGFKQLREGTDFEPLHQAARCRSEADWIVGLNGTRFFTVAYGESRNLWSVGRVQTPVLALVVKRDLEIENFKPEDYWEVHTTYRDTVFKHRAGRFKTEPEAKALVEKITGHDLVITGVGAKKERVLPPFLYDLTALQKDMNKRYGLTADGTLKAAQNLYERKHITYPRTDSQHLSDDQKGDLPALLNSLAEREHYAEAVGRLDLNNLAITKRMVDSKKVTDHHAIIPTTVPPRGLSGNEAKVYDAVVTRLIAAFYPPCIKGITTVEATCEGENFRARGTVILDPGWQVLYPNMNKKKAKQGAGGNAENQVMPKFEQGEQGPHEPIVKALKTKPPKHFTEATLLALMETAGKTVDEEALKQALKERGLGTPATRAAIIETLLRRTYMERKKKNLLSTPSGRHLIGLVRDERLKSAELTGQWEERLKRIEKGEEDPKAFMRDVVTYTGEIIEQSREADKGPPGNCPRCDAPLIEGKRGFGCSQWKEGCDFVLWKKTFGVKVSKSLASEILKHGKSLAAMPLDVGEGGESKKLLGKIVIKDGQVAYEEVAGKLPASAAGESLGTCPACGGTVIESKKAYGCANWREGCKFTIWKTIAKKKISPTMAKTLLTKGETAVLKGFTSRAGKSFEAKLRLIENQVKFVFPDRDQT